MAEVTQSIIPIITSVRAFEVHECAVSALAVFPDGRRIVMGLGDNTLLMWDLKNDVVLKKMKGHHTWVGAVAVSGDGELIASGDANGALIPWDGDTGESLTKTTDNDGHSAWISSLHFSPDGVVLATGSGDGTTNLWSTKTWKPQGNSINCGDNVHCVRYSPSGELLAIATSGDIQIWNLGQRERIANFKAHAAFNSAWNYSLAWMPDGTRLLSAGSNPDPAIREWDTSTWEQVGDPWKGHTGLVNTIAVNYAGTFVASSSTDHVRLWRLSDQRTIATFKHSDDVRSVTFSMDSKHILSAGADRKVLEWAVPEEALPVSKLLTMNTTTRNACITGDLHTAEALLTRQIDANDSDHNAYANRSFVRARNADWDRALHDALKSVSIQPSLTGCISKGIALCGKQQVQDAMKAFDLGFMFTNEDSKTTHFLLLIKAIALFNANQHEDAIQRIQELADICPKADTLACHIVEAYLRVQLGINALDGAHNNEAADHFTSVVNSIVFTSQSAIHSKYEDFVVLFGWDLKSLWLTANKTLCNTLLQAGRLAEAHQSYRYMMDMSDETMKASCLDWSTAFKEQCCALYAANGDTVLAVSGDAALAERDYDRAIELYSAAIDLDSATDIIFAKRSTAKLKKMLWVEALLDAQKVIELNPSSYLGYQAMHAALYGAQRYDEAVEAFKIMLSKLDNAHDAQIRELRQQYISPSEADDAIQMAIHGQFDNTPLRLINTSTGRLCDREAQIHTFETSTERKELLLSIIQHGDLSMDRIEYTVVTYFHYVMLSHRWEAKELLLHDIRDTVVYELDPVCGIVKLQSFCKTARDAGYRWAWVDTCCIDQSNNIEVQQSVNSMFNWYRHSALTIVYLSDVPPSSKSGALASSAWNTRGWTVPEFLAPRVLLFYRRDWTRYLDDPSPNHKESVRIMQEMRDATGIDERALVAFHPGMRGARKKLQWASTRVTTLQEDIAYSLFGIFEVHLPVIYGEKKQNALGRLLQEIVAQSGDISALDWVGRSSEFNSCLPADITSYKAPPCTFLSLSEDEIQTSASSLRDAVAVELAWKLYDILNNMSLPRFANRRLCLPCIAFPVTEMRRRRSPDPAAHITYDVKAHGLRDLLITTEDRLLQFSRARPAQQTLLLVRPWNRDLLELPDFAELSDDGDDMQSEDDFWSVPGSPGELDDLESHSRALQLIVRLGQPFGALLLAELRGGQYTRIASDHNIIAQVKDTASVDSMMDVRTLEIL